MTAPLWKPDASRIAASNLVRFMRHVVESYQATAGNMQELWDWSVQHPEDFWSAIWEFCEVLAPQRGARTLIDGDRMPGARWFPDAHLNFAENLLRRTDDALAIIAHAEGRPRRTLTWAELQHQVAAVAGFLRAHGVGPHDRVAGVLPNGPEAVVAMLATASIGAIWTSCSPDFGTAGIVDRFGQVAPKALLVVDAYVYGGKTFRSGDRTAEVLDRLPSVEITLVVPGPDETPPTIRVPRTQAWASALAFPYDDIPFPPFPFDHPLYVMYSSGTTGVPKCIVHGAGGTLIQHLKEHRLHSDIRPLDRVFYFTTCGWMMWNWLVSALASEATIVLYDGSPFADGPQTLWDLTSAENVTFFGGSAKYFDAVKKAPYSPRDHRGLGSLRTIASTGSPLAPETFAWIYDSVKTDVQLASISGGTDIISCFVLGDPTGPVWAGEISCRGLGMAVDIVDSEGQSVKGVPGELVCTRPFPSMPTGFWNDPDGQKYHDAYFARFPGIWCHGDWAELTEHGGIIIHGRSDAVLNPGGVRIGTAEIYRQVEQLDEVAESIAVGQDQEGDVRIILFVRLRPGAFLDDALRSRIKSQVRQNTTPRHVPALILQVTDIPRTKSGKITELAVREVIHGRPVKNREALANPEALEQFRNRPELQG